MNSCNAMKACINLSNIWGLSGEFHAQTVLPAARKHQVPIGWKAGWVSLPVGTRRTEYLYVLGIEPRFPGSLNFTSFHLSYQPFNSLCSSYLQLTSLNFTSRHFSSHNSLPFTSLPVTFHPITHFPSLHFPSLFIAFTSSHWANLAQREEARWKKQNKIFWHYLKCGQNPRRPHIKNRDIREFFCFTNHWSSPSDKTQTNGDQFPVDL